MSEPPHIPIANPAIETPPFHPADIVNPTPPRIGEPTTPVEPAPEEAAPLFEVDDERRFTLYRDQRQLRSQGARQAYDRLHQGLLAAVGGTVVLSFTTLKDIGLSHGSLPYLMVSWGGAACAGIFALVGLWTSGESDRERLKQLDIYFQTSKKDESQAERFDLATTILNFLAMVAAIASVIGFAAYLYLNVGDPEWQQRRQQRSQQEKAAVRNSGDAAQPRPTPATRFPN